MEYRILEETYSDGIVRKYKVIGDGFLSLTALWMAIHGEICRRMVNPSLKISLQLEKVENGTAIVIGKLQLDDRPLKEMLQAVQMPI